MNKRSLEAQLSLFDTPSKAASAASLPTVAPASGAAVGGDEEPLPAAREGDPDAVVSTATSPSPYLAPLPIPTAASSLQGAASAFDEHLGRLAKTVNTRRAFASDLRLLAEFLGPDKALAAISTDDLNRFLTWMLAYRGEPCSPKTYARRLTTLKVFFGWLHAAGALPRDIALTLVHRRAQAPLARVLTDREAATLLAVADGLASGEARDPRPAFMLRLLLDTGLKKGELVRLRTDDLNLDADPPSILVRYDQPRFARKERRVPVGPKVSGLFPAYLLRYRTAERLFPWTDRNLEYVLADLARAAGLGDEVSFETLRWTAALRAWRSGLAPDDLRELLGLSPITWVETEKKLRLLADGLGAAGVGRWFG
ncbi:MAG: site-specific integrase [Ardenticatenia bacterium]|nr:site-specific integrase [Ardenticatenia bacterium]